MVKLSKFSTALLSLILLTGVFAIGVAIQNPEILQVLFGIPMWAKISTFLIAVFAIVFDYAFPRIKNVAVPGGELVVTQGMLTSLLMGLVTIVVYVVATNPAILQPLLGNYYISYGSMIGGTALMVWNLLKPRYGEFVGGKAPALAFPLKEEEPEVIVPETTGEPDEYDAV